MIARRMGLGLGLILSLAGGVRSVEVVGGQFVLHSVKHRRPRRGASFEVVPRVPASPALHIVIDHARRLFLY